jgi:hypothetical protein
MSRPPSQPSPIVKARERMQTACMRLATVLDASLHGGRDPTSGECEEFEEAGLAYGRLLNALSKQSANASGLPQVKLSRIK